MSTAIPRLLSAILLFIAAAVPLRTLCATAEVDSIRDTYLRGDYVSSMQMAFRYLEAAKHTPPSPGDLAVCYLYLGNVNHAFKNYAGAIRYYEDGLAACPADGGFTDLKSRLYHNLSLLTCLVGDRPLAERYIAAADSVSDPGVPRQTYNRLLRQAVFQKTFGSREKSVEIMRGLPAFIRTGNLDGRLALTPLSEMFEMYEETGPEDSAFVYLQRYAALASEHNVANMMVDAAGGYMRHYARTGDMEKTRQAQEKYFALRDSLLNTEVYLAANTSHEARREAEDGDKIKSLEIRIDKVTATAWLLGSVLLILIAALVFFKQRKRLGEAYRALYSRNRELMTSRERLSGNVSADLEKKILDVMENCGDWLDPDFSISALSSMVNSNSRYVSALINDRFGKNFRAFINEYRVREAQRRLENKEEYGHLTLQAVGESVGFKSVSNFIAAFKKTTGLTPSTYQKIARSNESTDYQDVKDF